MRSLFLLVLLFLSTCDNHHGETSLNPMTIKAKVGETGEQFLKRNNLPPKGNVNRQPAGLNFYSHDWNTKSRGTVSIEHDKYSFQIPFAMGVMGTEDVENMAAGLYDFSINAGISSNSPLMHDEARKEFLTFLQKLFNLGWKPFIPYDAPRLNGEQGFKYFLENIYEYSPPVGYNPTLDEWMKISRGYWRLYAGDVFLKIKFQRDSKRMNPNELGAYLFTFTLHSKEEQAKTYFEGEDDRKNWQNLWIDKIKSMKKERYAKEKELIHKGYTIYTEYEEPKIHPADPVEP